MKQPTVKKAIHRLVLLAEQHARLVIAAVALATLVLGWFAVHIQADTTISKLIPESPEVRGLTAKYGSENVQGDYLLLIFQDPELFTARKLAALAQVCDRIAALEHVSAGVTPFNFVRFENREGRVALGTMAPGGKAPPTDEEAEALRRRLLDDAQSRNVIISVDGRALCAAYAVDPVDDESDLLAAVDEIVASARPHLADVRVSGVLPVKRAILTSLYRDLPTFLLLALAVVLASYFFSFGTLRAVLLPVLVVVVGTAWTVGTMALLGFRLSVVMVITPPLVLILGSSYSLHTLNQYYREVRIGGDSRGWIADSVQNVSVTIFLAASTTVFGFVSLISCSLTQVRQFGIATAIGIAYCAILALIFLPSVLSLLPSPTMRQRERVHDGPLTSFMARLARFVIRRRWLIVGGSLGVAAAFAITVGSIRFDTNFLRYFRYYEPAVEAHQLLIDRFTGFEYVYLSLSAPPGRPGYFQDPEVLARVARFEDALAADPDVKYLSSFTRYLRSMNRAMTGSAEVPETRPLVLVLSRYLGALGTTPLGRTLAGGMVNRDATQYTIQLHVWDHHNRSLAFEASLATILLRLEGLSRTMLPTEVTQEFWGDIVAVLYGSQLMARDQITSILTSALLVFIVSALIFRSPRQGLVVLVPMAIGVMLNFIIMVLTRIPLDAVTITFASVAIGIGVDNALHFMIWYRRQGGVWPADPERRIEETLKVAGRPMLLTTLSIMAALLVFVFSRFRPIAYFGVLISLSLLMTTAAAMLLLPALLYLGARHRAGRARVTTR